MSNEVIAFQAVITDQTLPLQCYLLGASHFRHGETTVCLPRRKVEALLAYLILHPEEHNRDTLATLFWGESRDDKARHSLRTALATLRQHIGDEIVLTTRERVQLNPNFPIWVDLYHLLAIGKELNALKLSQAGWLEPTLALWQADLLEGFYEDWISAEREHYRERLIKLFLKISATLRSQSEYSQAIKVAQHLLRFEPANEAAHQHLMFCYLATGERAAALRQYELCEKALRDDLDAPPLAETTALYRWIKQQEGSNSATAAKITNLPIPLTSFVGRTQQMHAVKQLLAADDLRTRLLTLVGAGGSGKTRLSIQVATDLIDHFEYGVWWVELSALIAGEQVAQAIAKSLGMIELRDESALQRVCDFLADKQVLLILDNCEHLIDACANVTVQLLQQCPNLQIMTTSRESLNVSGEVLWQVPPLEIPDPQQINLTEVLLKHECIRLFYERAIAVQPNFQLTLENTAAVVNICAQLEGIPLAIELAAARVKALPVELIAWRLSSAIGARFELLNQGSRTWQPRQKTLRAAIDWSYDLLDEAERQLFRSIAVFRGGFTLEALEKILEGASPYSKIQNLKAKSANPLDLLAQIVDKSLVIVEPEGGQNRYRMLETLREYALEQFASDPERHHLQQCHAHYFLQLAEEAQPALNGAQQERWLNDLEHEHANLRVALTFLIDNGDGESALRLASALRMFWDIRGYGNEGRGWLQKGLALRQSASALTVAQAYYITGVLTIIQSDFSSAREMLESGLAIFEQYHDLQGIVACLLDLSVVDMLQGDYPSAQQRLDQSLELSLALQDQHSLAFAYNYLGNLNWDLQLLPRARQFYLESLRLHQQLGNQARIAAILFNLGDTELNLGELAAARAYFDECLKISQSLNYKRWTGVALARLGKLALDAQEYEQAQRFAEDALSLMHEVGTQNGLDMVLTLSGEIAQARGETNKALSYYCQNLQSMYKLGHQWGIFDALEFIVRLLSTVPQHRESAVFLLGAAQHLRQELNVQVTSLERTNFYDEVPLLLRQQLGDALFNQLWEKGQSAAIDQVVALATSLSLL